MRIRQAADRFIHHSATELGILVLILISVALLIAETAFERETHLRQVVEILSDVVTLVFVVELAIRFWVARKKRRFFRRYWIDILAVLPVIRPLRLFRVLRLLRLFRAGMLLTRRLSVLHGVLRRSSTELTVLLTLTFTLVTAAAVTLHIAERGVNTGFEHLDGSVWYSVFSFIAGEPIGRQPVTPLGRAATLVLMLGGMAIFGMFVGTISATMVTRLTRRLEVTEMDLDELTDHVVVCGWNHSGPWVLCELFSAHSARRPVVLITETPGLPEDVPSDKLIPQLLYHVCGDYTRVEVLERARVDHACTAIVLSDKTVARSDQDRDARTVLAAMTIERLSPGIFTCAELRERENETLLRRAGVEEIVVADEHSGHILGSAGRTGGIITALDEILSAQYGNAFHRTSVPKKLDGVTVGELHTLLNQTHSAILVAVDGASCDNGTQAAGHPCRRRPMVNPPLDHRVAAQDEILVIARERPRLG